MKAGQGGPRASEASRRDPIHAAESAPNLEPAQTIVLVDDDEGLQRDISDYLRDCGYRVIACGHGRALDEVLRMERPDLVILDFMLPGEDGLVICRRLAEGDGPPVIMASAFGDEADRILGLELGADDYLRKPFSPRELLARIRAVLRRPREGLNRRQTGRHEFHFGGLVFEPVLRTLKASNGTIIMLSAAESGLLAQLLALAGQVMSRRAAEEIVAPLHPGPRDGEGRALDILVSRLRRKLSGHSDVEVIATVRGRGYQIGCPIVRS